MFFITNLSQDIIRLNFDGRQLQTTKQQTSVPILKSAIHVKIAVYNIALVNSEC